MEEQKEIKLEDVQVKVPDTFEIAHGNKIVTLKMTFFNLSRITKLAANNYEKFIRGLIDPSIQEQIVIAIFSEADSETGDVKLSDERKAFVADLTSDEASEIYDWCEAHITNFFMRRLLNRKSLNQKNEKVYQARLDLFKQLGIIKPEKEKTENSNVSKDGSKS